ncbi:MAG: DUF1540 domain-containing protein [Clostridia bacterium]|nr:DUF1540 domain-containing protein [Clostridia bacterium]
MEQNNKQIHCRVENCVHHKHEDCCTASHINVGPQYACSSADTVCSTFKPQSKAENK